MRDLQRTARATGDGDRFVDGLEELVVLVAHVCRVPQPSRSEWPAEGDELVARRECAWRVLEPRRRAAREVPLPRLRLRDPRVLERVSGKSISNPPFTVPASSRAEYCSGIRSRTPPLLVSTSRPPPTHVAPLRSTSTPPLLVRPVTSPARLVNFTPARFGILAEASIRNCSIG